MTIERIHIENGYPIDFNIDPQELTKKVILDSIESLTSLPEGEYSLTPSFWKNNRLEHTLVVFKDGTGMYRGLPKDRSVVTLEYSPQGEKESKACGRTVMLPQDTPYVLISGPMRDGRIGVFEAIFYLPEQDLRDS